MIKMEINLFIEFLKKTYIEYLRKEISDCLSMIEESVEILNNNIWDSESKTIFIENVDRFYLLYDELDLVCTEPEFTIWIKSMI